MSFFTDMDCYLFGQATHYDIYRKMGAHLQTRDGEAGVCFTVWAPNAARVFVIGDFNGWDRGATPMQRNAEGVWEVRLPAETLVHGQHVKVHVIGADNQGRDRMPAWIRYTEQDASTFDYSGIIWEPAESYRWKNTLWYPVRYGYGCRHNRSDLLTAAHRSSHRFPERH